MQVEICFMKGAEVAHNTTAPLCPAAAYQCAALGVVRLRWVVFGMRWQLAGHSHSDMCSPAHSPFLLTHDLPIVLLQAVKNDTAAPKASHSLAVQAHPFPP